MRAFKLTLAALAIALSSTAVRAADPPTALTLVPIAKGFEHPLYFISDPAGKNYVVEQAGRVWAIENGKKAGKPFLDISDHVFNAGECGLLSIAFHPDYAKNGRIFVNYVWNQMGDDGKLKSRICEYHVEPGADHAEASTEKLLLMLMQPYPNHKGGLVLFGADGMLYCGFGDGGSGGDPQNRAQNLRELHGKILRIDVDHKDDGKEYAVPKDNPFADKKDAFGEIWAYGLRNPWRFSFDPATKILYAGDVGQDTWEEIDIITKGGNYGWRLREGTHQFRDYKADGAQVIDPIIDYSHKEGLSVTGGYVYRGKKFPELDGVYLYGDYAFGRIWGLKYDGSKMIWQHEMAVTIGKRTGQHLIALPSFGVDKDGEIYTCDYDRGIIYQVTVTK